MRSGLWAALVAAVVVFGATPASEQAITDYQLTIYLQGGATPVTTNTLAAAGFTCGQPRVAAPPGVAINPSRIRIQDPANSTLDCVYTDPGTGPLLALPFNPTAVYDATILATNISGSSGPSARSNPFSHPGTVPSVPGLLRIGG